MHSSPRHGRAAFSLIELMTVIAIIVILAALIIGGLGYASERQAKEKCRVQMALLTKGIEAYKLDMGKYPDSKLITSSSSKSLYVQLFYQGWDYGNNPSRTDTPAAPMAMKIYLPELDPTTSKQGWVTPLTTANAVPPATTTILDPWGKEYGYRVSTDPDAQNPDFDLWSCGKDGVTSTTLSDKKCLDDIKNF